MARARNLKPAMFKNEVLGVADPLLTILFQSLWCLADREGRLEDRPLRIKAETFPYRENLDVNGYLTELERLEFICRYEVDGGAYIQVLSFHKHQNPHKTERASELPEMPVKSGGCTLTVKAPLNTGVRPADSLVLIPDSLLPLTDSGLPKNPPSATAAPAAPLIAETVLPEWLPLDAWNGFLAMRKKIKKPVTEPGLPLAIKKLAQLRDDGHDPRAVLENSTLNSYQGLFEPRAGVRSGGGVGVVNGLGPAGQATAAAAQRWLDKGAA